jgi:hypothetical protein
MSASLFGLGKKALVAEKEVAADQRRLLVVRQPGRS